MHELIQEIRDCNGYYECPRAPNAKRMGPLVGYAGRYDDGTGTMKQYVGDIYLNCAVLEEQPNRLNYWAHKLAEIVKQRFNKNDDPDYIRVDQLTVCGMPMGGIATGFALARHLPIPRFTFPEKKVTKLGTATSREESTLVFGRHPIRKGSALLVAEDVVNNFSTTGTFIDMVFEQGGWVTGIAALVNRSIQHSDTFLYRGMHHTIMSLVRLPIQEYRQDDPAVADDIAAGNVIWKPKEEWEKLQRYM